MLTKVRTKKASQIHVGDLIVLGKDKRARVDRVEHPKHSGCTEYGNGGIHIYSEGHPASTGCYFRDFEMEVEIA